MINATRHAFGGMLAGGLGLAGIVVITSNDSFDVAAQAPVTQNVPRIVEALNDCVQERFKEVEERLGAARVTRPGAPHVFTPQRLREESIVKELDRERLRVVLYLAGREVLKPKPDLTFSPYYISEEYFSNPMLRMVPRRMTSEEAIEWGPIKGPIRVTPMRGRQGTLERPPNSIELWDETRAAMQAFSQSEARDFVHGEWNFAARAIRINDKACLNCHTPNGATLMSAGVRPDNTLKIGDAIGVLLYGYRKLP